MNYPRKIEAPCKILSKMGDICLEIRCRVPAVRAGCPRGRPFQAEIFFRARMLNLAVVMNYPPKIEAPCKILSKMGDICLEIRRRVPAVRSGCPFTDEII